MESGQSGNVSDVTIGGAEGMAGGLDIKEGRERETSAEHRRRLNEPSRRLHLLLLQDQKVRCTRHRYFKVMRWETNYILLEEPSLQFHLLSHSRPPTAVKPKPSGLEWGGENCARPLFCLSVCCCSSIMLKTTPLLLLLAGEQPLRSFMLKVFNYEMFLVHKRLFSFFRR